MSAFVLEYDYTMGFWWMGALALQFGLQPFVAQKCATDFARMDPWVNPRVIVMFTELFKVGISLVVLWMSKELRLLKTCSWHSSLVSAGIPAISYSLQNLCIVMAYLTLDPLVGNLLNPTKILFTVIFSYILLGRQSNATEGIAFFLLVLVVLLLQVDQSGTSTDPTISSFGMFYGLGAAFLSGFGSAMCERGLHIVATDQTHRGSSSTAVKGEMAKDPTAAHERKGPTEKDTEQNLRESPSPSGRRTSDQSLPRSLSALPGGSFASLTSTQSIPRRRKNAYLFSLELSVFTFALTLVQTVGGLLFCRYQLDVLSADLYENAQKVVSSTSLPHSASAITAGGGRGVVAVTVSVLGSASVWLPQLISSSYALLAEFSHADLEIPLFSMERNFPDMWSMLPMLLQACGGICVGQVTKFVGGVAKGFAIVGGIVITAFAKSAIGGVVHESTTWNLYCAAGLVAVSLYLQASGQKKTSKESCLKQQ